MIDTKTLDLHLKSTDKTYRTAAEYIKHLANEGVFLTLLTDKDVFCYRDNYWQPIADASLRNMLLEHFQTNKVFTASIKKGINDVLQAIKDILGINKNFAHSLLHPQPFIAFSNGVVHIVPTTGEHSLHKFNPSNFLTTSSPFAYVQNEHAPLFDEALDRLFQNAQEPEKLKQFIYELIGYILSGVRIYPIFPLFIGNGANGKSFILAIISQLLGENSVIHDQIKSFSKDQFSKIGLLGRKAFIDDDMDLGFKLDTGLIKKLSESKPITTRDVYKSRITFMSVALPIVAGNDFPRCDDLTEGMKRRVCVVPFNYQLQSDEMNPHLSGTIIKEEGEAIIFKSLSALEKVYQRNGFYPHYPKDIQQANDNFFRHSNPLLSFIDEELVKFPKSHITLRQFREYCAYWAKTNNIRNFVPPNNALKKTLIQMGFNIVTINGYPAIKNYTFMQDI